MLVIFNDSCSKCASLADQLADRTWTPVRYLEDELTQEILDAIFAGHEGPVGDLIRTKESAWQATGLSLETATPAELKQAVMAAPVILQRPIILKGDQAIIARFPERVWSAIREL